MRAAITRWGYAALVACLLVGCGGSSGSGRGAGDDPPAGPNAADAPNAPPNLCEGVVCEPSDACHNAGRCNPATGACLPGTPKANGTACEDGNACTTGDVCTAGICGGSPVTCTASDQCHAAGVCDPETGSCSNPALPDGESCDDGNACTQTDTCQGGSCSGGNPVTCTGSDQCHGGGTCDPQTGTCSDPALPDGESCDDGDACTQSDTCQGGSCSGGDPVTCTASDQCHVAGSCDPQTGTCSNPAAEDGTSCDDGEVCTNDDQCVAGTCGGTPEDGEAPTRTLGFFKVHETALQACVAQGSIDLGFVSVSTLEDALGILWAEPSRFADGTMRSQLDRDRLLLARQLLTADCNNRLFGATPSGGLLESARIALSGQDCANLVSLEAQADAFNNSMDSAALPSGFDAGPATPSHASSIAHDPTSPSSISCTSGGTP